MNSHDKDLESIDQYIHKQLSKEDMDYVAKRIAEEADFRAVYKQRGLIINGIRYAHLQRKLKDLKVLEERLSAKENKRTDSIFEPNSTLSTEFDSRQSRLFIPAKRTIRPPCKAVRSYMIAAVTLLTFCLYVYMTTKNRRHTVACIASINTHKCW